MATSVACIRPALTHLLEQVVVQFESAINDKKLAQAVASHKTIFFAEKNVRGVKINYCHAVSGGQLQLVPTGESLAVLQRDYQAMLEDGLVAPNRSPTFQELMARCHAIESRIN